jgi:hypothetical protein
LLPKLYVKFVETNESRFGEEITRLVQGALKDLAAIETVCPEAHRLAARIIKRLRLLHEQFGIAELNLRPIGPPPTRSPKAG